MKKVFVWLLCLLMVCQPVWASDLTGGVEQWDAEETQVSSVSEEDLFSFEAAPEAEAEFEAGSAFAKDASLFGADAAPEEENWDSFSGEAPEDAFVGESYQKVTVNTEVTQRISTNNEIDWYSFEVPERGYISLSFSHEYLESGDSYWESNLYDSTQTELAMRRYAGNTLSVSKGPEVGVTPGTYYLKVHQWRYSDADYHFTVNFTAADDWETEWNENYGKANTLQLGATVYGSLMESDDVDCYKFTLREPGAVSVSFGHEYLDNNRVFWKCQILHSDLNILKTVDYVGNSSAVHTSEKVGLPAGTYYLKILPANYSQNTYSARVNFEADSLWEKEWNNNVSQATAVAPNTEVSGTLSYDGDVDWYAFAVPQKGYISLSFSHEYVESNLEYWEAYLYDSTQTEMLSRRYRGDTLSTSEGPKVGVAAGTYYVKVGKWYHADVDYHLTLNYAAAEDWEVEWNDEIKTATQLIPGREIHGSLRGSDDVDYFKLEVSGPDSLYLTFSHDFVDNANGFWRLYLYDPAMSEIKQLSYQGNTAAPNSSEKISVEKGTYYLKIVPMNYTQTTYNLLAKLDSAPVVTMTPTPVPATPTPAQSIPTPTPMPAVTDTPSAPAAFGDEAFEEAVREAIGLDEEDEITDEMCLELERLELGGLEISSLAGIEKFTNLTYLDCSGNRLTSLDVTKLTKLEFLDCSNNELTSLDASKNKKLEYLDVRGNSFASEAAVKLPGTVEYYYFSDDEPEATPTPTIPPAKITLNKTKSTLYVGSSVKKVTLKPALSNLTNTVTYTTSDKKVATVSKKGVVTAVKKGSAVITASVEQYGRTYSATCKITVKNPTVKVSSKLTVKVGKTAVLKVTTKPSGTVTYKSADAKIAKVSKTGVVTGVKKGKVKITVTCNKVSKTVTVTVKK